MRVDPGSDLPAGYPTELTEVAALEDGTQVALRAILPADAERLLRLFPRLSPQSIYRRFFTPVPRPNRALIDHLVAVDYTDRLALVALVDDEVVGVARYDRSRSEPDEADAAVIVEDAWQGRGLGTRLLSRLSAAAEQRGVRVLTAEVMAENRPMMGLLRTIAEDVEVRYQGGSNVIRMTLPQARR